MSTSVEDVEYLKKYGSKESHLFLIDSSKRDTTLWPSPAEYSIEFETPFRQVYGIDVIDATIPRTQYNVESFSNEFKYTLMGYGNDGVDVANSFVVEPADYEFNDFVTEFGEKVPADVHGGEGRMTVSGLYKMDSRTSTRSIKNKLVVQSQSKFRLDPCSLAHAMGFFFDSTTKEYVSKPSTINPTISNDYVSSNVATITNVFTSAAAFRQPFLPTVSSAVYKIGIDCVSDVSGTGLVCTAKIVDGAGTDFSDTSTINIGTTRAKAVFTFDTILKNFVMQRPSGDTSANTKLYYVEFVITGAGNLTVHGFNNTHYAQVYPYGPGDTISNFSINMEKTLYSWRIEAPYLYDFTGDTYLQIRCQEIEQHLFRTRAYEKYNAGLAKIPLNVFGFTSQDFDYTSFPPREFHPIGKLSTMTFRFVRPNGQLYDFKGINHTFEMVVRYYTIKDRPFDANILNPNYDPNILSYMNSAR